MSVQHYRKRTSIFFRSNSLSLLASHIVATPLPIKFVSARASDIKRSTPSSNARPSTGITFIRRSVDASTMNLSSCNTSGPFGLTKSIPMIEPIWLHVSSIPKACSKKNRCHRKINGCSVQVERISSWNYQAYHRFGTSHSFKLFHQRRKARLG